MSDKSVIIYSVMSLQTHMAFFVENWGTFRRICAITMNGRWFQALKMIQFIQTVWIICSQIGLIHFSSSTHWLNDDP